MKTKILTLLFVFLFITSNAQKTKSGIPLYLGAGFQYTRIDLDKNDFNTYGYKIDLGYGDHFNTKYQMQISSTNYFLGVGLGYRILSKKPIRFQPLIGFVGGVTHFKYTGKFMSIF